MKEKTFAEMMEGKNRIEVAEAVGITQTALSAYERGERIPRDEVKIKLADYFQREENVTINDVRRKCSDLVISGRREAVENALIKFNVQKITQIPESEFGRFLECLDACL